ncbi:MAG: phenylalanine--tRNA ligase subunit alpha [Candidatus Buchananbacteria bacterium]|jgi:phenylalanyl-tRNA synthetase alpha chain
MKDQLNKIKEQFGEELPKVKSAEELEELENKFLSRKSGLLTNVMKGLKDVAKEEVAEIGTLANELKNFIAEGINLTKNYLSGGLDNAHIDYSIPGNIPPIGHLHLATIAMREISEIFKGLGFQRQRYPDIEWDYYAFETLNMPGDHPARDEWETFFIDLSPIRMNLASNSLKLVEDGKRLLTPHTSSGQVREMEKGILPIRMMNISKCYRRQIDVSHVPMFHQFEGLVIDKGINITHLKGTIEYFVKKFFGADRTIRLRPHHFQFTEPSFEVDISCGLCHGSGKLEDGSFCRMCKEGWLELAGAGMVHPNVLKAGGIDPAEYSGFAFGWGVERCYSMKSGLNIDDLRLLYKNDLRFNKQF